MGPIRSTCVSSSRGVSWRSRTGSQWWEMPPEFGAWSTVYQRFAQWRDVGVFETLMEGVLAEAARTGEAEMSLVSVDSTVARAHHDAAGMRVSHDVLAALEDAAGRSKGAHGKGTRSGRRLRARKTMPTRSSGGASNAGTARG